MQDPSLDYLFGLYGEMLIKAGLLSIGRGLNATVLSFASNASCRAFSNLHIAPFAPFLLILLDKKKKYSHL